MNKIDMRLQSRVLNLLEYLLKCHSRPFNYFVSTRSVHQQNEILNSTLVHLTNPTRIQPQQNMPINTPRSNVQIPNVALNIPNLANQNIPNMSNNPNIPNIPNNPNIPNIPNNPNIPNIPNNPNQNIPNNNPNNIPNNIPNNPLQPIEYGQMQ